MLLSKFYKPSDKTIFITLSVFAILSFVIILFDSFIYREVIIINIIAFCLLSIMFKEFVFYAINWIVILLVLLHSWKTIDIKLNKINYYNSFKPLMRYECLAGYDLRTMTISPTIQRKQVLSKNEKEKINACIKENSKLIEHLKNLGCNSIDFSKNNLQLWYNDIVIDIDKIDDHTIVYETSDLH